MTNATALVAAMLNHNPALAHDILAEVTTHPTKAGQQIALYQELWSLWSETLGHAIPYACLSVLLDVLYDMEL